jgi:hypothetical protein
VSKRKWLSELLAAEMLVIPRVEGSNLGGPLLALDRALDGLLSHSISANGFHGRLGERLLVEIPDSQSNLRHLLFVGLGNPEKTVRPHFCGLFGLALESASDLAANKVTLPLFPSSLWNGATTMKGVCFVLGCRMHNAPSSRVTGVKELEVLASAQAKRFVEQGLQSSRQLCFHCSDPQLPVIEG